jgi:hypothetical protein
MELVKNESVLMALLKLSSGQKIGSDVVGAIGFGVEIQCRWRLFCRSQYKWQCWIESVPIGSDGANEE